VIPVVIAQPETADPCAYRLLGATNPRPRGRVAHACECAPNARRAANTAAHCGPRPALDGVPGPVTSAMCEGRHALLRRAVDPAVLSRPRRTCLESLGFLGALCQDRHLRCPGIASRRSTPGDRCPRPGSKVGIRGVAFTLVRVTRVAVRARGRTGLEVVRALPVRTLNGLVETVDGGDRAAAAEKPYGSQAW
jgi:hypothetical protein